MSLDLCWRRLTCVPGAGGPLGRHAVPLQGRVCVGDGQQVVVPEAAADAGVGVQQAAGVAARHGHPHVVVGGRQTLLEETFRRSQHHRGGDRRRRSCRRWETWAWTYTDSLPVDHQVNVFVDLSVFVVRLGALAGRVVGLDVGAVAAV